MAKHVDISEVAMAEVEKRTEKTRRLSVEIHTPQVSTPAPPTTKNPKRALAATPGFASPSGKLRHFTLASGTPRNEDSSEEHEDENANQNIEVMEERPTWTPSTGHRPSTTGLATSEALERLVRNPDEVSRRFDDFLGRLGALTSEIATWEPLPNNGVPFTRPPAGTYDPSAGSGVAEEEERGEDRLDEGEEESKVVESSTRPGVSEAERTDELLAAAQNWRGLCRVRCRRACTSRSCVTALDVLQLLGVVLGLLSSSVASQFRWPLGVIGGLLLWDWFGVVPSEGGFAASFWLLWLAGIAVTILCVWGESKVRPAGAEDVARRYDAEENAAGGMAQTPPFADASRRAVATLRWAVIAGAMLHVPATIAVVRVLVCAPPMSSLVVGIAEENNECAIDEPLLTYVSNSASQDELPLSASFRMNGGLAHRWSCDCYSSRTFLAIYVPAAVMLLVGFVVPFPLYLWFGILSSAPDPEELPAAAAERARKRRQRLARKHARRAATLFLAAGKDRRARIAAATGDEEGGIIREVGEEGEEEEKEEEQGDGNPPNYNSNNFSYDEEQAAPQNHDDDLSDGELTARVKPPTAAPKWQGQPLAARALPLATQEAAERALAEDQSPKHGQEVIVAGGRSSSTNKTKLEQRIDRTTRLARGPMDREIAGYSAKSSGGTASGSPVASADEDDGGKGEGAAAKTAAAKTAEELEAEDVEMRKSRGEAVLARAAAARAQVRLETEWRHALRTELIHEESPFSWLYRPLAPWSARWAASAWVLARASWAAAVAGLWPFPAVQAAVAAVGVGVQAGLVGYVAWSRGPGRREALFADGVEDAWMLGGLVLLFVAAVCVFTAVPTGREEDESVATVDVDTEPEYLVQASAALTAAAVQVEGVNGAEWPPEARGWDSSNWGDVASTSASKHTVREYVSALAARLLLSGTDPLAGSPPLGVGASVVLGLAVALWLAVLVVRLTLVAVPRLQRQMEEALAAARFGRFGSPRSERLGAEDALGLPGWGAAGHWDLSVELPLRLWHSFWDALLARSLGAAVAERWRNVRSAAAAAGPTRVREHAAHSQDASILALREWIEAELEGPDAFYDGPADDGSDDSASHFGSVRVAPYPFHVVFSWDDVSSFVRLWDADLPALVRRNTDPAVLSRRLVREQLRALDGHEVPLGEAGETVQRLRDFETGRPTDAGVRYSRGVLTVRTFDPRDPDGRGFIVTVRASGGTAAAMASSGRPMTESQLVTTLGADDIGLEPSFRMTRRLRALLWSPAALRLTRSNLPRVQADASARRESRRRKRTLDQSLLHHDFYHEIYLRPGRSVSEIIHHLQTTQAPTPLAHHLLHDHPHVFSFLARRAATATVHPVATLWFLFFHDLWDRNAYLPRVHAIRHLLDPSNPSALAYRPMPRNQLDKILSAAGLGGYFFKKIGALLPALDLDLFYAHLRILWLGSLNSNAQEPPLPRPPTDEQLELKT